MSNPTTPFSWQMPTSTDLVTDLPADFEVFGQAVASSMADLLGGTSGQILSKASNTDMDFTWIANDQGDITAVNVTSPITGGGSAGAVTVGIQDALTTQKGAVQLSDSTSTTSSILAATPTAVKSSYDLAAAAIPKSTVTTNGDTIYGTGSGTVTRLGIGSTGQVLTVAAGVPSWATASSGSAYVTGKNIVINGGMDIWQRGTSIACSATAYTADRWQGYRGVAGATVSRQTSSLSLAGIQYCARVQRDSGNTSTSTIWFSQAIETANSYQFANKTIVFSFYARAGANYSAASSALNVRVRWGTGTDQNPLGTWTGGGFTVSSTATLTTSWQRFTFTGTVDSTATQLATYVGFDGVGTAGAADYFEITGVQLEQASSVTDFSRAGATIQGELAACQRYYYRKVAPENFADMGLGFAISTTSARIEVTFPVYMRVQPNALEYSTLMLYDGSGTNVTVTSAGLSEVNNQSTRLTIGVASGLTQFRPYSLLANNSTSAYVGFSSEL